MFATLLGAVPPPGATIEDSIAIAVRAQEAAGLEPITDGRLRDPGFDRLSAWLLARARGEAAAHDTPPTDDVLTPVEAWRSAAALTDRAVKQALPGPYTLARRAHYSGDRARRIAEVLREEVEALAAAGCPLIEIEEAEAHAIGKDEVERRAFGDAHRRLTEGFHGPHLSLSIVGGAAWGAGLDTVLAGSYSSVALDLITGPDDWNIVTRLPRELGVVVGALPPGSSPADAKEVLVWAAHYAAASGGRGLDRVGLGSAGSWADLGWDATVAKLARLGEAARLAASPPGEQLARSLDPRAVDIRSAALGRFERRPGKRRRAR